MKFYYTYYAHSLNAVWWLSLALSKAKNLSNLRNCIINVNKMYTNKMKCHIFQINFRMK